MKYSEFLVPTKEEMADCPGITASEEIDQGVEVHRIRSADSYDIELTELRISAGVMV